MDNLGSRIAPRRYDQKKLNFKHYFKNLLISWDYCVLTLEY